MYKEVDLAKQLIGWLKAQNWEVWQEVKLSKYICPIHDIIAVKGNITWCIECKLSFSLKVIDQVYRSNTILKSIAVPNMDSFGRIVCNKFGIGIITVKKNGSINECVNSKIFRENYKESKNIIEILKTIPQNYSEAGSKVGYWSPYKNTIRDVRFFIKEHPGCKIKDIMVDLKHHYASDASARSSLKYSLEKYEKKWCEIKDGCYYIREEI